MNIVQATMATLCQLRLSGVMRFTVVVNVFGDVQTKRDASEGLTARGEKPI
ncbi:MAG: hypothetical protein ACLP50_13825 [Solirubrobacteraceae bacterium]